MSTPENGNGAPRASGHLARLNRVRDDRLAERTIELRVPGWEGPAGDGLAVRLRALPFVEIQPLSRRMVAGLIDESADPEVELRAACDALSKACVDIHGTSAEGAPWALDDAPAPEPCRFDQRTCELLQLPEPRSAREAVLLVYRGNRFAVMDAWGELATFTRGGQEDVTERLLGEART